MLGLINAIESCFEPIESGYGFIGDAFVATALLLLKIRADAFIGVLRFVPCLYQAGHCLSFSMREKRHQCPDRDSRCIRHLAPQRIAEDCLPALFGPERKVAGVLKQFL